MFYCETTTREVEWGGRKMKLTPKENCTKVVLIRLNFFM